ncbi:Phosphoribosyl 1,2-cyclic phosphodiesterase [Tangfeifania diversioriginum]|uniref:Phosphoribosyl 1,2-cyclic phosphodiesterase n=1 Tax=Tangfeifania diversioriginum TaxID=1168035 RepID=A0A1M6BGE5_9BACT|nr:MBL fold metallo-hydrolase [Tangfeifania diversioriginum]SHI47779.1 Phosphoribosyl 1,2-cyclic phosphodiesterase [Tangfeifania diversioriginum]
MLDICAIASGSNGNCYYIGNEKDAILIDAGISCKQILLRMESKGLNPKKLKAVIISHEHSDHMRGARVLAKRLNIPVWMTAKTYYATYKNMQPAYPQFFAPGSELKIGKFTIHPFLKNHDAAEPCSFRVEYSGKNIGVFTDIGEPCENVISHLGQCDVLFLETNYDEQMLTNGPYPFFLKQRISSSVGHLSNIQAVGLLETHGGANLKCVFLSHLSAENNTPELALSSFEKLGTKYDIRLTSRHEAGEVFVI